MPSFRKTLFQPHGSMTNTHARIDGSGPCVAHSRYGSVSKLLKNKQKHSAE